MKLTELSKIQYLTVAVMVLLTILAFGKANAQQCNIVYVKSGGATSGTAGTKSNPANLSYGISLANVTNNQVYLAAGTYIAYSAVIMKSDITLEGGFDAITWEKSNGTATIIYRDNSNVESSPSRLVAMYCMNLSNFRLQDLTIRCADGFGGGTSSYGVYLSACSNYNIVRCKIISGNAGNGESGSNGTNGTPGAIGSAGQNGDEQGPCCTAGGIGGSGTFLGSYAGGDGGNGGDRGDASCSWCGNSADATNGYPGQDGFGPGGGVGGNGGFKRVVCVYPTACAPSVHYGQPGSDGSDGLSGTAGADGVGNFTGGFYVPTDGTMGSAGTHGSGAGGGGGSGSLGGIPYDCLFGLPPNWNGSGAGGGGGGEGGEAALQGLGGTGGGASFAVYLNNNGASGLIQDCNLTVGNPGLGGLGGAGGIGGPGGAGGPGGGQCAIGYGGDGGNGGTGGGGGAGGAGSSGVANKLYEDPSGDPVNYYNINSLQQPLVYVKFSGCTDAPVTFYTDATGTIEWFFGAGSVPSNTIGSPSIATYTTTGRKTFTMVVNGIPYTYSDFIDIFSNGAGLNPTIVPITSDTLCAGDIGSFASSVTAASYTWYIMRDTMVDTFSGAGLLSLSYIFDSVGTYTVVLETRNSCCGVSFPDTFTVTVNPIIQPSISIQSSDTSNTVCDGTTLTFSALAGDVSNPQYSWFVNGVPAGSNSPTFSTSTLADGDIITAAVMTTTGCSIGLSDSSNSITVTVVGIPAVTCTADTFVTGFPTYFTATVVSGGITPFTYLWDFGDQTMGAGDSVAHIYLSPGVYDIQVDVVDANGCPGTCNLVATIYSILTAAYTASVYNGCAPLTVDFSNQSTNAVTYLWDFGDGSTLSAISTASVSHTYTNPGTYDVVLYAYGASGNDSDWVTSQVFVLGSPVANFQGYPQLITTIEDTVFFGDNSLDAWMWQWNFGDPISGGNNTSTIQNPAHYYALEGSYTVSLVVTNAFGCSDSVTKPNFIVVNIDTGSGVSVEAPHLGINTIVIFPNPVSSELNVLVEVKSPGTLEITMINMSGQRIRTFSEEQIQKGTTKLTYSLNDVTLSKGLYFLDVNYNGKHYYKKIILTP
ncbi:MAG: hypothetical protein COB85_04225 [Bacteroidetes bacterium]|nr:MAG: hypothetical protein COB85_04225 [Bacteroidota bacterium]